MIREINARIFVDMLISGANNLINNKQKVDDMNVFPVPDGDTGTNMSMTMRACVAGIKAVADSTVSDVATSVSNDTLRGARGNSGVILSQLMRGFKKAFADCDVADVALFAKAFKTATDCAYRAVMKPTEGTILTVAREMSECAVEYASQVDDFEAFFALVTDAGNKALQRTPELLPKLKQAGVVDAGGQGLMYIVEGMHYFISKNEIIPLAEEEKVSVQTTKSESENIRFAYCTECIIDKKDKGRSAFKFQAVIEKIGDSMVIVDDDDIVKLHVHTNQPDVVLQQALKIGSLSSVKIENMKLQHSELVNSKKENEAKKETTPKEKFAFVSVAVGEGISSMLKELGVNKIIQGGQTMNPSTEDIIEAIEKLNAETIFVFPNNSNIIMTSQQAAEICGDHVVVVPTKAVTQSMSCMLVFDPESDKETNASMFEDVISSVKSAQITNAVRDTSVDGIEIKEGEYLSIVDGKIKASLQTPDLAAISAVELMVDSDSSVISVFYGEDIEEKDAEDLAEKIEKKYPDCDVILTFGSQPVYHYLISVE